MNYGAIKKNDIADGPGVRVSLFVSGCRHHCKNCFNKETWDFFYGQPYTKDTENEIIKALEPAYIAGFTLLGGEPFEPEHRPELVKLLSRIKKEYPDKTVWCYTGFDFEKNLLAGNPGEAETINAMLENIDVLVDGRFIEELKSPVLLFRGSSNQRIIDVKKSLNNNKAVWLDGIWERKMGSGNIYDGM